MTWEDLARAIGVPADGPAGAIAGGECSGAVPGDVYVGSGNALASALVFGAVAGRSAARAARAVAAR